MTSATGRGVVSPGCTSMPSAGFRSEWQIVASYYRLEEPWRRLGDESIAGVEPDLLYSFVGSRTDRCRDVIYGLPERADVLVESVQATVSSSSIH